MTLAPLLLSTLLHAATPGNMETDSREAPGHGWFGNDGGAGGLHLMVPAFDLTWLPSSGPDIGIYPVTLAWTPLHDGGFVARNASVFASAGYTLHAARIARWEAHKYGISAATGILLFDHAALSWNFLDKGRLGYGFRAAMLWGWRGPVRLMPE